jgi:hypothetical protein
MLVPLCNRRALSALRLFSARRFGLTGKVMADAYQWHFHLRRPR